MRNLLPILTSEPKLIKKYIRFVVLCISIISFLGSLLLPAFHLSSGSDKYLGFQVLLLGWVGPLSVDFGNYGYIGWYANLFLPPIWLAFALSKSRIISLGGLFLSIISTGLALCSLFLINAGFSVFGRNESESIHDTIAYMSLGFYLWLASIIVCVLGYLVIIGIDYFMAKNPNANK